MVIDKVAFYLGLACGNIANILNPSTIVIGGGVSRAGEIITTNVEKYYNEIVMAPLEGKKFVLATLGNDAGIYGGAKMALDLTK